MLNTNWNFIFRCFFKTQKKLCIFFNIFLFPFYFDFRTQIERRFMLNFWEYVRNNKSKVHHVGEIFLLNQFSVSLNSRSFSKKSLLLNNFPLFCKIILNSHYRLDALFIMHFACIPLQLVHYEFCLIGTTIGESERRHEYFFLFCRFWERKISSLASHREILRFTERRQNSAGRNIIIIFLFHSVSP